MRYHFISFLLVLLILPYACDNQAKPLDLLIDKTEINLTVGEKETITVTQAPVSSEVLIWESDNETVATVFFGIVTAVSSGTATITATLGDQVATCIVTVADREYELIWSDEFDGTSLNTDNWTYEIGTGNWGWGNNESQYYTDRPENIRVENGMLIIEARKESYQGSSYTSARIKTANKKEFTYGKIEARLKVPSGAGTWPAFWMLGKVGGWPGCGEIDIMEHVGKEPKNFHCALHTLTKNGMNGKNPHGTQTLAENCADDFHVITLEWKQDEFEGYDRIHIYVDDVLTKTFAETAQLQESGDWPFNTPFYFIVNLAIGGNWGGTIDDNMFNNPVLYQLDYIRVYQLQ